MSSYSELLRDELVRAAARQRRIRRRHRVLGVVAAGCVLVAGAGAVIVGTVIGSDDHVAEASSVEVTKTAQGTHVTVIDRNDPDGVIADLRSVGVTVERVERGTGPSKVGTVVSLVVPDGDNQLMASGLEVQLDGRAFVQVGVGVPARQGDAYDVGTDAFAPGEPLWCRSWPGQPTAELAEIVADGGLALSVVDGQAGPIDTLPDGKIVVTATALAADRVLVTVDDGDARGAPPDCSPAGASG